MDSSGSGLVNCWDFWDQWTTKMLPSRPDLRPDDVTIHVGLKKAVVEPWQLATLRHPALTVSGVRKDMEILYMLETKCLLFWGVEGFF